MVTYTVDQGWGNVWILKQFETSILQTMLRNIYQDQSRAVLINSVWYSKESHGETMSWLANNEWDQIVVVAMLDAAIPQLDWYNEFNRPVTGVGYYPGAAQLDFWALFVDQFLQSPAQDVLLSADRIDTAFMCLNRKPHWHRVRLYNQLAARGLVNQGLVSMGGTDSAVRTLIESVTTDNQMLAPNSTGFGITNDIVSLGDTSNWCRSFLNVITETTWDINQSGFVSEKIYKPIVGCRPFLVYDPDGATQWLRDRGFETYTQDFKDISDLDLTNPHNLPAFLEVLCAQPRAYWPKKFLDLQSKIMYNKQHFADYVRAQRQIIEKGIPCQI